MKIIRYFQIIVFCVMLIFPIDILISYSGTHQRFQNHNQSLRSSATADIKCLWNKTWSSGILYSLTLDSSDNLYATGFDGLFKFNSSGDLLWNRTFTSGGGSISLCFDSSENLYITGTISYYSEGGAYLGTDIWLSKYNSEGSKLWNFTWYTQGHHYSWDMDIDSNDNIYIWGEIEADGINPEYCLIKFDNQGNYLWNLTWRDPILQYYPISAKAIYIDDSDNIYLGATSRQMSLDLYYFHLYKFNTSGSQLWARKWNDPNIFPRYNYDLTGDLSGDIYIAGGEWGLSFLLKYNSSGALQWEITSDPSPLSETTSIALDKLGNIYCSGRTSDDDIGLMKYNNSGSFQWTYEWGGINREVCYDMIIDSTNSLYLSGYSRDTGTPNYEFCLLKLVPLGMFEVLSPLTNQIFGREPPYFEIDKLEPSINKTWYSLNHVGKFMFTGENGIIDESAWDACDNGKVIIDFVANDTFGSLEYEEITVIKDVIAPNITILSPLPYRLFGNVSPNCNILVDDPDLDTVWYTLDSGLNNFTVIGNWITIDQEAWSNCNNGSVDIIFYANDTIGNIASKSTPVYKDIDAPYIQINLPEAFELYGKKFEFNLELFGTNIDTTWYTLNDGIDNIFNGAIGLIEGSVWEDCEDGLVLVKFYINDSDSKEVFTDIYIYQDSTAPQIIIHQPYQFQFFSETSPEFNVSISDAQMNMTWYTIDSGVTNITFSGLTGLIDQNEWNKSGEGDIYIRFYANDTANNINFEEIVVHKDTINPLINIETPMSNELFLDIIPDFNVSISDTNLNKTWYTLNGGLNNYFNGSTGTIDQQTWELCEDGYVNITFYATDFSGNIEYESVTIRKNFDSREAYAIIVGISNYPGSSNDLNYCDDDAIAVYNMLINDFNFKPENIIYIQDSGATKTNINNAFDTIASQVDPNDIFFFYYSGHGGRGTYTTQGTWNVETLHPYWTNYDQIWSVSHPGAIAMRVHFERFQTEDYYDYALCGSWGVTQGYYYEELTGNLGYNFWSSYIPVSRYYIRFISDSYNPYPYYGFKIDKYEAILEDGTHFLCSYDSIPSNPSNYYLDTLIDSKLDNLNCEEKYVVADSCNSGGLIPEIQDIGRYIMTACRADEESLETSLLEHGIFTYYLLEAKGNATDLNNDGVISMEESYDYIYSNTLSESGSYGSEYQYHPQENDGIIGESVLYPSIGAINYEIEDNKLNYSFFVHGNGMLKILNITVCSLDPVINFYTFDIKHYGTSTTGFGLYQGTLEIEEGYTAGGFQILAEIEGYKIITIDLTIGDSDGDGLTDFIEIIEGLDPSLNDTDSDGLSDYEEFYGPTDPLNSDSDYDGLLDGEEVNIYLTNPLNNDTDNDNLYDGEEINIHFTNPLNNDTDNDNLYDGEEVYLHFTDPLLNDTDSDNLYDGEEVNIYLTNPLLNDTDFDRLTDYEEVIIYHTNPLEGDTDSDGLLDGDEVNIYNTDPLSSDTDSDLMPDKWEVDNSLDPLTDDSNLDPDNDYLTNILEYQHNTDPQNPDTDYDGLIDGEEINTYNTDPLVSDSDSDGLLDGDEVNIHSTDPLVPDTDSDGLSDGDEVNIHSTDPLSSDTDSDMMPDKWEVDNSLNPLVNDAALDPDNDLLINGLEYENDTDPQNTDTDGDGWTDGDEVLVYETDPLDPDDFPNPKRGQSIPGFTTNLVLLIITLISIVWFMKNKSKYSKN